VQVAQLHGAEARQACILVRLLDDEVTGGHGRARAGGGSLGAIATFRAVSFFASSLAQKAWLIMSPSAISGPPSAAGTSSWMTAT
jgi:hypothetical protein